MLNESEYDRCVGLIYDAALEPLRLKHALAEIIKAVNAPGAHLVGFQKTNMEVRLSAITGLPLLAEIDYNERYAKVDPRAQIYMGASVGEWRSCHHYLPQSWVDGSEFFQQFLIPYGGRYCSCGKLFENESHAVFLGVHTGIAEGPLDDEAMTVLKRVTPHLQRAMQLIYQNAKLQNQWAIVKSTLDMLDYSSLVCDESGEILVANEAAVARGEQRDGISVAHGRLSLTDAKSQARLRSILKTPSEETDGSPPSAAAIGMPVARKLGPPLHLIARKLEGNRTLFCTENRSLWSIMISDPSGSSAPTMRALSLLYGLTPAESRIAAMLVAGSTIDEIAAEVHISINTVRSHVKNLFQKTSTNRQAELVRVFSSPPALRDTDVLDRRST